MNKKFFSKMAVALSLFAMSLTGCGGNNNSENPTSSSVNNSVDTSTNSTSTVQKEHGIEFFGVEDIEINLTTRGMKRRFLIFNDGRKNNSNFFDLNSCYNNKKFNLRIYKTNELENYIINTLKYKVNGK